jgi:hypothetical protein
MWIFFFAEESPPEILASKENISGTLRFVANAVILLWEVPQNSSLYAGCCSGESSTKKIRGKKLVFAQQSTIKQASAVFQRKTINHRGRSRNSWGQFINSWEQSTNHRGQTINSWELSINYKGQFINCGEQSINHRKRFINPGEPSINYKPLPINYKLPSRNSWQPTINYKLLPINSWRPTINYWELTINCKQLSINSKTQRANRCQPGVNRVSTCSTSL